MSIRTIVIRAAVAVTGLAMLSQLVPAGSAQANQTPGQSSWFGTLRIEPTNTTFTTSDGDLWPSCWGQDNAVYTAWGDGRGFDINGPFHDIGTARLTGDDPRSLQGVNTAVSDGVSKVMTAGRYSRKPTGMVCVGNTLYLAVQDLAHDFNDAPAATIVKSNDGGKTWQAAPQTPMFDQHTFTTIWFADFGPGGGWNDSGYVYAYALDGNWRTSTTGRVPDPTMMFMARVPKTQVQQRKAWQFYAGTDAAKKPRWTSDIAKRVPVLEDTTRTYPHPLDNPTVRGDTVLAQGHVVYNKALKRYLYSTWTEVGHRFYEAPQPWGPWTLMTHKDYTTKEDFDVQYGGYGTSLPSKFISGDGRTMWLQSNRCCGLPTPARTYNYSMRKVELAPANPTGVKNLPDGSNLVTAPDTVAVSKSVRQASLVSLSDGNREGSIDDHDGDAKQSSLWGYTWPATRRINQVSFTTGVPSEQGGWFVQAPRVQVRRQGVWHEVPHQSYDQPFVAGAAAGRHQSRTITFPLIEADGVRIIGAAGGDRRFTSMAELSATYTTTSLRNGGFEAGDSLSPWNFEGQAPHGLDKNVRLQRSGLNNAWIRTNQPLGDQLLTQGLTLTPGKTYTVSAWIRTSASVKSVLVGARWAGSSQVRTLPVTATDSYQRYSVTFTVPAGVAETTLAVGIKAEGGDAIGQFDDVELTES